MENKSKGQVLLTFLLSCVSMASAQTPIDSVDTYLNQTVSSSVSVQGREVLTAGNINVTSTGYLKLSAPNGISIVDTLTVQLGGILELNGGSQYRVRYYYDAVGNRNRREKYFSD